MEFVSIGGLVKGITINDIMLGISQPRNDKLAAIFYRLKLIEAYGTGIIKIMDNYNNYVTQPILKVSDHAFVISIPNMNNDDNEKPNPISSHEKIIFEHLQSNSSITRKTAEQLLDTGQTTAGKILKYMAQKNLITTIGSGKNTKYILHIK
jgi:ATP-dependent DNA helicase RecG